MLLHQPRDGGKMQMVAAAIVVLARHRVIVKARIAHISTKTVETYAPHTD